MQTLIWLVFGFLALLLGVNTIGTALGFGAMIAGWGFFQWLLLALPVGLLVIHSCITLSPPRAIFFMTLAMGIGWIMEVIGLRTGTIFGGQYQYHLVQPTFLEVPISVILYWAVFIYTGYCVVNAWLYWSNRQKPNLKGKQWWLLPWLIFLDGWSVVAIDLFMDPLEVLRGSWTWLSGGPYFGVPIGNFVGWFLVSVMVTGIFRSFEFYFPRKEKTDHQILFIIPVLGYLALAVTFLLDALAKQLPSLAVIGSLCMFPLASYAVYLFWRRRFLQHWLPATSRFLIQNR